MKVVDERLSISIIGGKGKFGTMIADKIREGNEFIIDELIDVGDNLLKAKDTDVYVDVTNAKAFSENFHSYNMFSGPLVMATTGLSPEQIEDVKYLAKNRPVIMSGNFSITMYNFIETVKEAAKRANSTTNVTIIEYHHITKKDKPSGTAKMIKEAIISARPDLFNEDNVDVLSVRGGTISGIHEVVFANKDDEVIKLSHEAGSRKPFATGLLEVCKWIAYQPNGFYTMDDFMKSR